MPFNSWAQSLITQQIDGTALASSTAATSIIAPAARFTLPANLLLIGTKFRIKASGRISTLTASPGTLTLDIRFGSVIVFNGGAMALNVTAQTNATWEFEADLTCRSIGASTSATMFGTAHFISRASLNAPAVGTTNGVGAVLLPDTAPAVGTGFDSTVSQTVDFFGTWSTSSASNSIQTHQYELILCN